MYEVSLKLRIVDLEDSWLMRAGYMQGVTVGKNPEYER